MALLWIRNETHPSEKRTPITPEHASEVINHGHKIVVETSDKRAFSDDQYIKAGCSIAPSGDWISAPNEAVILGLKELSHLNIPLKHTHIYFAHAYNDKKIFHEDSDISVLMRQFKQGNGMHYDLELLVDKNKKRITSFGREAGCSGACIGLLVWAQKQQGNIGQYKIKSFYTSLQEGLHDVQKAVTSTKVKPHVLIIGKGCSSQGVTDILQQFEIPWTQWGRHETASPQKLLELLNYDIFFNCISVKDDIDPFLRVEQMHAHQKLSLIIDITSETYSYNPLPIYAGTTSYENPTHCIPLEGKNLDIVAIDNLPSFFPLESSISFSSQLLPHLIHFLNKEVTYPWQRAGEVFNQALRTIQD